MRAPRTVPKFMQVDPIGVDLSKVAFLRLQSIRHIHDESTAKVDRGAEEKVIASHAQSCAQCTYEFVQSHVTKHVQNQNTLKHSAFILSTLIFQTDAMLVSCVESLKDKSPDAALVKKTNRLFKKVRDLIVHASLPSSFALLLAYEDNKIVSFQLDKNRNNVICIDEIRRFARKICGFKSSTGMKSVMNAVFDLKDDCAITADDFSTAFGYLDAEVADAAITGMLQAFKDYQAKREPNTELVETFMTTFKMLGDLSVGFANEQRILERQREQSNR